MHGCKKEVSISKNLILEKKEEKNLAKKM